MTDEESESASITFTIVVNAEALVATTVVEVSGDDQSSQVSTALDAPFVVEVRDQNGDGLSGVTVAFAVTAGGGTLSASSVTTNSSGQAESTLTLGSTVGTNTVTATATGITTPVTFTATGTAEDLVATTLDRISGNDQTATVSTVLDDPFVVEVQDQNGDVLSGATVTFAVTIGDGTLSDTSVTTDSNGRAESTLTLGSTAGSNRAVASVSGITQTRTFNATGTAVVLVATALVEVSGDSQTAVVSTELSDPFVVQVNDQNGDAFSGAVVTFAVASGGGTLSETSVTTGADGRAETTLTLGSTAGSNTVTADVTGISTTITFTASATAEALVATSIVRVSGNNQTGTVGKELDNPFVVEVRDQNGDGLSGITVAFAVTAGGGTVSDASVTTGSNGQASSSLTLGSTAGTNTVRATATGITTTRNFNATGEATAATTVVIISGDNRTAAVSTTLSTPFVVEVRDQDGDALSGVTVAFAVTAGGGSLSSASVTTGSNGRASSTLTLGSTAGTNTVTATATGITTPVTFTATGTAVVPQLAISVTVPATADLGETIDISATVAGEDTFTWETTGGSIDDPSAVDTEITVPSESGVIAVTGVATDADGETETDTAYVTVGDPTANIYTPAVRIEMEGQDITSRWIRDDGISVGKSLAYPQLSTFLTSGVEFNVDNEDGDFDYNMSNNFFLQNSLPAHGRGAKVLIQIGLSKNALTPVFAGQVYTVETSLINTKARIKVADLSTKLRQNTVDDFGQEITRRITDFEGANAGYDEFDRIFFFPTWGLPIAPGSVSVTVHEGETDVDINIVDLVAISGTLSNENAEIDYSRGLIRFEAPPTNGADTQITATWKVDYKYKRPDFLVRQLLKAGGTQSELGITDDEAARFGIDKALVRGDSESFSSHGRPYPQESGVARWIRLTSSGKRQMIQDTHLVEYDESLDEYTKVTTLPTESGLEGVVNDDYGVYLGR